MKKKTYFQHLGKVIEKDSRFEHVMALTLDPNNNYTRGIIRCIQSREGDVQISGYIDRSVLYYVRGESFESFKIENKVMIKNQEEMIKKISEEGFEFIGFEDPDIFVDEENGTHLYFTMPFIGVVNGKKQTHVHLGHAFGKDIDSLEMAMPVLVADEENSFCGAKEVSIAPINKQGTRFNLIESARREEDFNYSIVQLAIAREMNKRWEFGPVLFHPKEHHIPWIQGHASPGPLFPKTFIDVGEGKLLGILNGREASQKIEGKTRYGMFSVGLFIYDYEKGEIDWVSPEPFIQDSEAATITFASQFIETGPGRGILYAHVDDSFVRAYSLEVGLIRQLLP